jgi:nickel/cobalt transporter (NicO) family protein
MRPLISLAILVAVAAVALFWVSGVDRVVLTWALEGQRAAQNGMAGALRALRAGETAAVIPLLAVCFTYGFFHAAGPGHGKLLIGGYGAAREVGAMRLSAVALASSLAQGATAILLVAVGIWLVGWSREYMTDMAERLLQPLGFLAIAAVGLWLALRGNQYFAAQRDLRVAEIHAHGLAAARGHHHGHHHGHGHGDHHHGHDAAACGCGHAHAPTPEAVAAATGWRELAALVAAVAIRPCTGALFLLILTAQMGLFAWGVAGTFAMALGTASVTVAVALGAVGVRKGFLAGLAGGAARFGWVRPTLEIAVGLTVAAIAGSLAVASF